MKQAKDMTKGKPFPILLSFTLPLVLGNIFQQFYSMVDAMVVGRFVSKEALAAIGATNAILFLMISLIIGFTMGTSITAAQFAGAKDLEGLRSVFAAGSYISLIAACCLALLGCTFALPALRLLGTPEDIIGDARVYLTVNFSTCIAPITYNMISNYLRSLGDSKTPLFALILSSVTNICLDLLFVLAFQMGVAGVALATAIAQFLSTLFCLFRVSRGFREVLPQKGGWRPKKQVIGSILKFGMPMAVQNIFVSFGMMSIQGIINGFGTNVVAGYTAAAKVDQIALQFMTSIGSAVSTYAGQNYGAKNIERIFSGLKASLIMVLATGILLTAVILPFGKYLVLLFIDASESEAISVASGYLYTVSIFYLLCGVTYVYSNALRGMGFVTIPTVSSFVELGAKILTAMLLSRVLGYGGIWLAWPVSWLVSDLLLAGYFHLFAGKKTAALFSEKARA